MNQNFQSVDYLFVKGIVIVEKIGLSKSTLKRRRLDGTLIENVHWQRLNSRTILYNLRLMMDWIQNYHDPRMHQLAIEAYLRYISEPGLHSQMRSPSKKRTG